MAISLISYTMLLLSLICVVVMFYKLSKQAPIKIPFVDYAKLSCTGFISFIADTLGIGSFAVNIALSKLMNTFSDEELPAVNNGAQVIPGVIESLFFMQLVDVDLTTLLTLVIGTCIGGLVGGAVVTHLSKQAIRAAMMFCFTLIIFLLLGHQLHLMPVGGDVVALSGWKLLVAFIAMIACGALTSVGIGLFVMVQGVLFLLNVSPMVAFPIMTTAGAMQQPLTTLVFLQQDKIPLKKTLIISLSGCVGVLFAITIFTHLTISWLHTLLLGILIYNLIAISRTYFSTKRTAQQKNYSELKAG